MQKGKKFVTFALISSTYGTTMDLHKEGVNGMVCRYEKVTVISSVVHTYIRTYVHTKPSWKLEMGSVLIFLLLEKLGTP